MLVVNYPKSGRRYGCKDRKIPVDGFHAVNCYHLLQPSFSAYSINSKVYHSINIIPDDTTVESYRTGEKQLVKINDNY